MNVFAGATIMGDGRVALILDVLAIAQRANVVTGARVRAKTEQGSQTTESLASGRQSLLLFSTRDGGRMAIPLSIVARLEEFPLSSLERTGDQFVVQYRGEILPLLDVARQLGAEPNKHESETIQVVVYAGPERQVGLIVGSILDIVDEEIVATSRTSRAGVLHSAIVQGRVAEFLDVEALVNNAM